MSMVFLDTVGLLAMWDGTDQWHPPAQKALQELDRPGTRLITTLFVMLECGNAASRKPYRTDVDLLRRRLEADGRLIVPTESDVEQAWANYRRGDAGDAGIVDHVSFIVMRRLGIVDAFSNDRHFRAAGFNTLF